MLYPSLNNTILLIILNCVFMNKKELLWAIVAIVALAIGGNTFELGAYKHVWHIMSVPTYMITSVPFIVANIAISMLWGQKRLFLWKKGQLSRSTLIILQGAVLCLLLLAVDHYAPMCRMMAKGMLYSSLGMVVFGCVCKIATFTKFVSVYSMHR
jgi:hypothetical protein